MKIHYQSWLFKLPLLRRYAAIVLARHCFIKDASASPRLIRHELIHQEQMDRHGICLFYCIYMKDYLRNLWRYRDHNRAYEEIPFEREAYEREGEMLQSIPAMLAQRSLNAANKSK